MPIQIGSLNNVPAPGDPITSPWAQQLTPLGVHRFTNKAALDAQWNNAADGALAVTVDNYALYSRRGGVWMPQYQVGSGTYAFDANGSSVITHGLVRVPFVVLLTAQQAGNVTLMCTGKTSTTFTARCITGNTGANFVGNITVGWWAA